MYIKNQSIIYRNPRILIADGNNIIINAKRNINIMNSIIYNIITASNNF